MIPDSIYQHLSKAGINFTHLLPTSTGLAKSIFDATSSVREYFEDVGYHIYSQQGKGPEHKIVRPAVYAGPSNTLSVDVRLYRPKTKDGDPRIWFGGLKKHIMPEDLLILTVFEDKLHIFNATQRDLLSDLQATGSILANISGHELTVSKDAELLLESIHDIYNRGFVRSLRKGDTGVGFTLEELLGIKANSSQDPDIFGIELKAGRMINGRSRPKSQLFSKTPDWKNSPYTAWETITKYGYSRGENATPSPFSNYCLRCSIDAVRTNSQGLLLEVRTNEATLWAKHIHTAEDVFIWGMDQLKAQLLKKHSETFWIGAEVGRSDDEQEMFRYSNVIHTKSPSVSSFERLLGDGGISVDLTMSVKNVSTKRVRDHGYLFKVKHPRFTELFPVIQEVSFSNTH